MTLLETPPCTCFPEDDPPRGAGLQRAADAMSSAITLHNGHVVQLAGTSPGMSWPPNYLEDLRAGRM